MPGTTSSTPDAAAEQASIAAALQIGQPDASAAKGFKCMAPTVLNAEGISCDQGLWIDSGGTCAADCADGFYASIAELTCMNGTLTPAAFECIDWYNKTQNIVLIAVGCLICVLVVAFVIVLPHLLKHTPGGTYRAAPDGTRRWDRAALLPADDYRKTGASDLRTIPEDYDDLDEFKPGQAVSVQSHGEWLNAEIQQKLATGLYKVAFEDEYSGTTDQYEDVLSKNIRPRQGRTNSSGQERTNSSGSGRHSSKTTKFDANSAHATHYPEENSSHATHYPREDSSHATHYPEDHGSYR